MSNISEIMNGIKADALALAKTHCDEFIQEANAAATAFIDTSKEDFAQWALLVSAGHLKQKELESLVRGKRDLVIMKALKAKGLAQIRIDSFVNGIIDSTIKRITG